MTFKSVNPATEEVIGTYEEFTDTQVRSALEKTTHGFNKWRKETYVDRGRLMTLAGSYLRKNKSRLAGMITAEMGKPILEAEAEIEKCALTCDYFAENTKRFLAATNIKSNASQSYVSFEPLGTVLAIMPWNFPFWQVFRFAAPALMAGNVALLKHASNVSQCALAIEEAFREADFPSGVFQTLLVPGDSVSKLIADPSVHAVTLTGSDVTGSKVAEASGKNLKKAVLELGGSDPFIVLADADVQLAADTAARARNQNTGQSCIAAKRFIVVEAVAREFEHKFVEAVAKLKLGDPTRRDTQVGPLARADLRETLEGQVQRSVQAGAKIAVGGRRPERRGYFYEPTVLTEVTPDMAAFHEETFGPVAAITIARDSIEAIRMANMSQYGLGAALWTADTARAKVLAREIQAGSVFINGMVASDPRLPFGGVKRSGYGRELSEFGIREFTNVQTIWIGPAGGSGQQAQPKQPQQPQAE